MSHQAHWTRTTLAEALGGRLEGPDGAVLAVRDPLEAGSDDAVVVRQEKYLSVCLQSPAGLVVIGETVSDEALLTEKHRSGRAFLRVADTELAWERLLHHFAPHLEYPPSTHPSAQVHPSAVIGENVHIGPNVTIEQGAQVGADSLIMSGSLIGQDACLGRGCQIHPNVSILHGVILGDRVLVQSGAVVGSDGFGFRRTPEHHHIRLPQIGTVVIEDDVEIGANSVVDRGALGATRIGARTKIGPACIVAHNGQIGQDVLLIGAVQLAGSVAVGDRAVLWGQVGVIGHLTIGAGATVTAQSGVSKDLPPDQVYRGSPARPYREQMRLEARIHDLERMAQRIKQLEDRLAQQGFVKPEQTSPEIGHSRPNPHESGDA
jgi:UDP-3-O-[3-hydroxymyristoyl] glucosamine N-acyltransferase